MARRQLLSAVLLSISALANAQDSLFYTNGSFVVGQVEEVGLEAVRYRTFSGNNSVVVVAEKRDLARIKLHGGQEFVLNPMYADVIASDEFMGRTHAISVDFIAPALNHLTFGYEQVIGPRMSLVVKAGYIGIGNYAESYNTIHTSGALGKVGIKFILPVSRRRIPNARDGHPLAGWYLKPELMASGWSSEQQFYDYPYGSSTFRNDYFSVSLNMTVGRQVLLGERFTFDLFGGLGYGTQWKNGKQTAGLGEIYYNYDRQEYAYSHAFLGSRIPLTVSGGMMFGFLF